MTFKNLKPCAHCGGRPEFKTRNTFGAYGYQAQCVECRMGTPIIWVDLPVVDGSGRPMESSRYNDLQARQKAGEIWNRRPKS